MIKVIKKNGVVECFNGEKIIKAITKSANRAMVKLTNENEKSVVKFVQDSLQNKEEVDVSTIHNLVEVALELEHPRVGQAYKEYRDYKKKFNDSFNSVLKDAERIIYSGDKENANKDSCINSTKMTLTAELVGKELYLNYELPKHLSYAHRNLDMYIHDAGHRWYNMVNCIEENGWITYKDENGVRTIQLKELGSILNIEDGISKIDGHKFVLGRNGWTKLKAVMRRPIEEDEEILSFKTRTGLSLNATKKHKIPVIREGKEIVIQAGEIVEGDILLTTNNANVDILKEANSDYINLLNINDKGYNLIITDIDKLKKYISYKYDRSLQSILKENNIPHNSHLKYLTKEQFLKISDKIEIPYDVLMTLKVKAEKNSQNKFPIFIPVTESLAKLYGYIYADGGVYVNEELSTYHLTFTNTNEALIDDFIECFYDVFDVKLTKIKPKENSTSPCMRVVCGSRVLVSLFSNFADGGKKNSGDISMPDFILNGSKRVKLAYLSSCIDCDGHLSDKAIGYCTSSLKYTEQITQVIKSLGYNPTLITKQEKGKTYHFRDAKGCRNFDNHVIKIYRREDIFNLYNELNTFKQNPYYEKYEDFSSQKFEESKILKIEKKYYQCNVYDLETESNWFIVNDYVVHNCCLLDVANIFRGGFKLNNKNIKEPNSIDKALDLLNDIIFVASSQQYGGLTIPEIDNLLSPYVEKTYNKLILQGLSEEESWNTLETIVYKKLKSIQYKIECVNNAGGQLGCLY